MQSGSREGENIQIPKVAVTWRNWETFLQHCVIIPNEGQRPEGKGMGPTPQLGSKFVISQILCGRGARGGGYSFNFTTGVSR